MYQKVILAGYLGGDPEMRYFPDGTAVTNFSMATSKRWTDRGTGEQKEETTWFHISVFGSQAEACNQYLSKGSQAMVEGELKPDPQTGAPRLWTRQDGTVGVSFEVRASRVVFMGRSGGNVDDDAHAAAIEDEDAIPF